MAVHTHPQAFPYIADTLTSHPSFVANLILEPNPKQQVSDVPRSCLRLCFPSRCPLTTFRDAVEFSRDVDRVLGNFWIGDSGSGDGGGGGGLEGGLTLITCRVLGGLRVEEEGVGEKLGLMSLSRGAKTGDC